MVAHVVPSYQISPQSTIELLCNNKAPWITIQTCGTYSRQKSLHPWCPMVPMVPNGAQWCPMVPNGAQWCPMVPNGAQWCPMVPNGAQWCPMVPNGAQWCLEDPGRSWKYHGVPFSCKKNKYVSLNNFEHDLTTSYCVSSSQVPRSSHIVSHWLPTVTATKGPSCRWPSHFRVPKDAGKSADVMTCCDD